MPTAKRKTLQALNKKTNCRKTKDALKEVLEMGTYVSKKAIKYGQSLDKIVSVHVDDEGSISILGFRDDLVAYRRF